MNYQIEKINEIDDNQIDDRFFCKEIDSSYLLTVSDKKYLINYEFDVIEVVKSELICINNWSHIALLSLSTGDIVYLSGLRNSFLGVIALERDIVILSDTELFLLNKDRYFPYQFKSFTDNIIDYEIINDGNLKILMATEGEKIVNVYSY